MQADMVYIFNYTFQSYIAFQREKKITFAPKLHNWTKLWQMEGLRWNSAKK